MRLDLIDSVARSLSMLLAVPDRAYSCLLVPNRSRLRSFLSRSSLKVRLSGGEAAGR